MPCAPRVRKSARPLAVPPVASGNDLPGSLRQFGGWEAVVGAVADLVAQMRSASWGWFSAAATAARSRRGGFSYGGGAESGFGGLSCGAEVAVPELGVATRWATSTTEQTRCRHGQPRPGPPGH